MSELFSLAPAGKMPMLILLPIALVLLAMALFMLIAAFSTGRGQVELAAGTIKLKMPMYGRTLPLTALRLDSARVVDLTRETQLGLKWRTNGIGLPRYNVGWFKLRSGEKALAYVTSKESVLYIPTTKGYVLLLSASEPERLLAALRRQG